MFVDIVDATQLSMHAKIPEKIMLVKKQNKDLVSAVADLETFRHSFVSRTLL